MTTTWNGSESLSDMLVPLKELHQDPGNVRVHKDRDLAALAASLSEFGQTKTIVALRDGTVIAGNGTLVAAKRISWTHLAVSYFDDVDKARAYSIADNKTAELSEWDFEGLANHLRDMTEAARLSTGFADFEIEPLLAAEWAPPAAEGLPDRTEGAHNVSLNEEQWGVFKRAVDQAKGSNDDMTRGAALVAICESFMRTE